MSHAIQYMSGWDNTTTKKALLPLFGQYSQLQLYLEAHLNEFEKGLDELDKKPDYKPLRAKLIFYDRALAKELFNSSESSNDTLINDIYKRYEIGVDKKFKVLVSETPSSFESYL